MKHYPILLAGCVLLAGCDVPFGVVRTADMPQPFSPDCMRRAVETTPGVARVRFHADRDGGYTYGYDGAPGSAVRGVAQALRTSDGGFHYRNNLTYLNAIPAQAAIDATRPVMRAMEGKLAAECGIIALPAQVQENCTRVACPPL